MAFINVSHLLQYSLSKHIKSPLFETPKVKIPRLSSSVMTSPASPSKWTHSSPRGPIWTPRCPNHSRHFNCYHTCSITHLHVSSAVTLMSTHTLERHPAQSCLSVCFSLPHIPKHTDTESFCRLQHCFILCQVLILLCAGSMLICQC